MKINLFGATGAMFLHDSVKFFGNIIKPAQPYAEICKRAKQIYKNQ